MLHFDVLIDCGPGFGSTPYVLQSLIKVALGSGKMCMLVLEAPLQSQPWLVALDEHAFQITYGR